MIRAAFLASVIVPAFILGGCNISFSDGINFSGNSSEKEAVTDVPSGAAVAEDGGKIEMGDITLTLPDGMKYGTLETDTENVYYVWGTDKDYVFPTDSDIIFYAYSGTDSASPDKELTDTEARYSISQTYLQTFRDSVDGRISADPSVVSNDEWYVLQLTGYSGDYISTSYGTMCYPKCYYGVYTLQKVTDSFSRSYYGFVFSNDSTGAIMEEADYNDLYGQIKRAFSITEFYTAPQLEYNEATDYSNGYSYEQLADLFSDTANYYGMSAQSPEETESVSETESGKEEVVLDGTYEVVKVVDGDTIIVDMNGGEVRVRLIGIDTPESVSTDESKNTAEGKETSEYTTKQLAGNPVYLEYDEGLTDTYGRILAYVYLEDGETMFNKILLEQGYARVMAVEPNIKYAKEFEALEADAEKSGAGFWGTGFFVREKEND